MPPRKKKAPEDGPAYYPHPDVVQDRMNEQYPWHEWRIERWPENDTAEEGTGKKICAYRAFAKLDDGEAEFMIRISPCSFPWLDLTTSGMISRLLQLRTIAMARLREMQAATN